MSNKLFTIGHSNHEIDRFLDLLQMHQVQAVADVRSHPYSRFATQFSMDNLKESLLSRSIRYVFLGGELGARSSNPECYLKGKVQYDRLAMEPEFKEGIERVAAGLGKYSIALMCAEKDPVDCHRSLLVARALHAVGLDVSHIHADGSLESQVDLEGRLLEICKLPPGDMFRSKDEFINDAYSMRGEQVAYQDERMDSEKMGAA